MPQLILILHIDIATRIIKCKINILNCISKDKVPLRYTIPYEASCIYVGRLNKAGSCEVSCQMKIPTLQDVQGADTLIEQAQMPVPIIDGGNHTPVLLVSNDKPYIRNSSFGSSFRKIILSSYMAQCTVRTTKFFLPQETNPILS